MAEVTETHIRDRKAIVEDRIGRHEMALAYLNQELKELESAIRVFERFHERPNFDDILPLPLIEPEPEVARKPSDVPPMPEMIITVLKEGLGIPKEPKDIVEEIRRRWWPNAPATSVGPVAWRMAKEGRLFKGNEGYTIPLEATSTCGEDESDLIG